MGLSLPRSCGVACAASTILDLWFRKHDHGILNASERVGRQSNRILSIINKGSMGALQRIWEEFRRWGMTCPCHEAERRACTFSGECVSNSRRLKEVGGSCRRTLLTSRQGAPTPTGSASPFWLWTNSTRRCYQRCSRITRSYIALALSPKLAPPADASPTPGARAALKSQRPRRPPALVRRLECHGTAAATAIAATTAAATATATAASSAATATARLGRRHRSRW